MRLDGARVVVTGASSGIGRAIAEAVADHGGRLLLAARRAGPLNDVAGEIAGRHPGIPRPAVIALDVADPESGAALWRGAHAAFGGLDVLINNAGISVYGDTLASSVEDFRRVLAVNVLGPVSAMLTAMPHMVRQGSGVIVNVASVAALHGVPFLAAYAASKAALASVTQTLRGELAGSGVRLICVYPGYTRTPIFGKEKRLGGARRPAGRYASPARVAAAVVRAIEGHTNDVVLSLSGRMLWLLRDLSPSIVRLAMRHLARRLRVEPEVSHVPT